MNDNIELLNFLYQNVKSEIDGLTKVIELMQEKEMRNLLKKELKNYESIQKEVNHRINEYGKTPIGISKLKEIKSYSTIKIDSLWSGTRDYVSGILKKDIEDRIVDINKKIGENSNADKKILDIAKKLLEIENNNLEELGNV
jgi:hypothetical protein